MRMPRLRLVITSIAALALVLPVTSVADAQSKGTIKIATQSPLSGGQAVLGEGIKLGAQLAVEKMKGNLEKMGYKVDFVPFDDQAKPDVGVANAKNIIADKDIMAVIGHLNSGVAIPSSEVYKEVTLAMISPANTNPVVTDRNYPNVNRVCGRDDVQGVVGSEFAHGTLKIKSAYIVHDKTQYGQSIAEFFKADAEKKGVKVLGFEGTEEKSNFDPLLTPIKAKNPDLIYFGGIYDQGAPFFKQAREKGIKSKFMGPDGMDSSDLTKIAGKAVVGMNYTSAAGPASALPKAKAFVDDFKKKFSKNPEPYAAEAYDATVIAHQGHRGRRQDRQDEPRGRLGRGPQGQALRHHRRDRLRRQGRPAEGPVLRAVGGERQPGEVGRQQDHQAAHDRAPRGQEVAATVIRGRGGVAPLPPPPPSRPLPMDFELLIGIFPQVLLDGITLGFMYALIALGYTMVYGVLEFINFAHSEIFIIGAFVGVEILLSFKSAGWLDVLPWVLVLLIILVAGMAVSGVVAVVIERTAYRPLRHAPRLIPLISAIGVSFFLQDVIRLFESLWRNSFNLVYPTMDVLNHRFELTDTIDVSVKSLVVIVAALLMLWGLHTLVNRTKVGKAIRAVAEDQAAASLMGINVNRIISLTFLIGGAMGGGAGVLFGVQYSLINPVYRLHPRAQGLHRRGPRRHRQRAGSDAGRARAGTARGLRGLLPVAAHRRRLRGRVQGHLRVLDPHPDPHLQAEGPPGRDRPRAGMIKDLLDRPGPATALVVALLLVTTWGVTYSPRSIVLFMLFQGSILLLYFARIPTPLKAALTILTLGVLMPILGTINAYYMEIAIQVGIFVALALGLNIVVGLAGLLDLGYVAFFAVGAYSWAIFGSPQANLIFGGEHFPLGPWWFFVFLFVGWRWRRARASCSACRCCGSTATTWPW